MATYVEQLHLTRSGEGDIPSFAGAVVYSLTSAANGTALTGTGDALYVTAESAGWLHISTSAATDKAAATKTHRFAANATRLIGGVVKGMWISFLEDS